MTRQQILGLLHDYSTAMMVTHAQSGPLDCRPMHVAHLDPQGPLWFFASSQSRKVTEVRQNAEVLLVMQNERRQYGAVWGRARVVDDPARVQQFWREPYRAWFAHGQDDPDLVLIAVLPHTVEFWDATGVHKLRYVFEPEETYIAGGRVEEAARDRGSL
jgi:general stress protein 26